MSKIQTMSPELKPRNPILILEDVKENQDLLKGICKKMGIPCEIAENGEVGLQLLEKNTFSIYIVDLIMPVMDGRIFIQNLKKKHPESVVLVQTALDTADTIIDIMKLDVFDYIVKPIDLEVFQKAIHKSLEYKYLKDMERNLNLNAGAKIRNQIEWLNYKEDRRVSEKDDTDIKSIYNLKTSITQGTGFGSLLTLIDLVKGSKVDAGDVYKIDKQIIDLLINNYDICNAQLEGLHSISKLLEIKCSLNQIDATELVAAIPNMVVDVISFLSLKDLRVTYPELKTNCKINVDMEKLSLIIEELFINAYKYAVHKSAINIFSQIKEGYFWLSFMNEVYEEPYGGVPPEYEKLVLEPFFRLLPPDETIGMVEKYGLGLGLSVVDNIIRKHNGMFMIHDVKDHTHDSIKSSVLAEILLPVIP
ncbi:MAG: response regulator [Spirochaetota bacterium]|nr:response regulator [Spirochaetota bacterium]